MRSGKIYIVFIIIIISAVFEDVPCVPKLAHQLVLPSTGCSISVVLGLMP
jgi:hypothetical protein